MNKQGKRIMKWFKDTAKNDDDPLARDGGYHVKSNKFLSYLKQYWSGKHKIVDEYIEVIEKDIIDNGTVWIPLDCLDQWFMWDWEVFNV